MNSRQQLSDLRLFDARPPRYTSYPTAPHFSPSIGAADVARWLAETPADEPASIYVHVPFCRRLCWFCACRTQGAKTDRPIERYLDALETEIGLVHQAMGGARPVSRLHFGGGTPTILKAAQTTRLIGALDAVFPRGEDAEFSVEIDPNEIDQERIDALAAAGLNRASVGVQDFDPAIQETIGRLQTFEQTAEAIGALRAAGVDALNVDLVYGLPGQTAESIRRTVRRILWLKPSRIALYGYAHVPWMAKRQVMIPTEALPSAEERLDLYEVAAEVFTKAGYAAVGIDHFALPEDNLASAAATGALKRNFQGYTDDQAETLIGVGASAVSRFAQGYAQNNPATKDYQAAMADGRLAAVRGHAFTASDHGRAYVIERLMCDFAVDLKAVSSLFGDGLAPIFEQVAKAYAPVVELTKDRFSILPSGAPLTRIIAREFDEYGPSAAGHSLAT